MQSNRLQSVLRHGPRLCAVARRHDHHITHNLEYILNWPSYPERAHFHSRRAAPCSNWGLHFTSLGYSTYSALSLVNPAGLYLPGPTSCPTGMHFNISVMRFWIRSSEMCLMHRHACNQKIHDTLWSACSPIYLPFKVIVVGAPMCSSPTSCCINKCCAALHSIDCWAAYIEWLVLLCSLADGECSYYVVLVTMIQGCVRIAEQKVEIWNSPACL